jgi:hypothetical protein
MEGAPRLYDTLVHVLSQHQNWVDRRHLKTLCGPRKRHCQINGACGNHQVKRYVGAESRWRRGRKCETMGP